MMTQTQPRKPRSKPSRTLRLYPGTPALVEMTIGSEAFSYWLRAIAADFGLGFEVKKPLPDGTVYHVNLHGPHGHSCECPGYLRWGHCKHVEALLALEAKGQLPQAPSKS